MVSIIMSPPQRALARILGGVAAFFLVKWIFWDVKPATPPGQIAHPAILERIALGVPLSGQSLDTRKYPFLQTRINRDEAPDLFDADIRSGLNDFWTRFQKPFITNPETTHLDEQVVRGAVDELLGFNGWAAAACSSLTRPFGAQKAEDDWSDLARPGALYYFALVVHGADHFLIDQLAVIVQLSKRLGPGSIFVSLLDYASTDSTPFICDMAEAIMTLLGISFRIRQVPPMTSDPTASYYPLEEAYTRNLALEPLHELWERRKVKFTRVIWLKGFTCPNDILETIRVSMANQATMVCGMDWKEHNGFFIYNDRWRTRDMDGNLFRGSKSTSPIDEAPPRDSLGSARYSLHLPFQVFCCESGSHIVDPHKSYYEGISYKSAEETVFNTTNAADGRTPKWSEGPCMDSAQLHFCRDLWMLAFRDGIRDQSKRIANLERQGKGEPIHPFMKDLIGAMHASLAPQTLTPDQKLTIANSGDYLPDETNDDVDDGQDDGDDEEEDGDYGDDGVPVIQFDPDSGGQGRPLDLAVPIEDEFPVDQVAAQQPQQQQQQQGGAKAEDVLVPNKKAKGPAAAAKNAPAKPPMPDDEAMAARDAAAAADVAKKPLPPPKQPMVGGLAEAALQKAKERAAQVGKAVGGGVKGGQKAKRALAEGAQEHSDLSARAGQAKDEAQGWKRWLSFWRREEEAVPASNELERRSEEASARYHTLEKRKARSLPNSEFDYAIAKILVNPRCVTTYAGVSHAQLALDLFGTGEDKQPAAKEGGKYVLDEWRTAPESFVCQEMRTTGGRTAPKQQRRTGFQQARLLLQGWRPT